MFADDVFRNEFAAVTARLKTWADALRDSGKIDIREGHGFWSLAARPNTPGACPVTLVLRHDQKFDLALGPDRFEDRNVENFALFPALLQAVSDGRVERRRYSCAMTGAERAYETRVLLDGGIVWAERRGARPDAVRDGIIEETSRALPYTR